MTDTLANAPLQISEIILRTNRYDELTQWYRSLFGDMEPTIQADTKGEFKSIPYIERLCFLRIHVAWPFSQILGIFEVTDATAAKGMHSGMDHMQFRDGSLENLFLRYEWLLSRGVTPTHCYDHGPGTSFYYKDPDGNVVELSASNFDNAADHQAFFHSEAFRQNVEGHEVEPQAYIIQRRAARAGKAVTA